MNKSALDNSPKLVKFGLSEHEALIYETLVKEGSLMNKDLAKKIGVLPNAIYRLLDKLILKGLITKTQKHPAIYKAISPSIALDIFVKKQAAEMEIAKEDIVRSLTPKNYSDQTRIDLLKGAGEFFQSYAELSKETKNEILIISIGETVPEEVLLANRDSLEKGIKIRFIAHKFDQSNKDILIRWKRMGIEVKHFPDWGFHLVVFDSKKSLLSVNNPKNTNDRLGMKIFSEGLSKALNNYFYSVWEKAVTVE